LIREVERQHRFETKASAEEGLADLQSRIHNPRQAAPHRRHGVVDQEISEHRVAEGPADERPKIGHCCGAALIALRIAQPIRLGIEQGVQRLLHGAPHHAVEVAPDPPAPPAPPVPEPPAPEIRRSGVRWGSRRGAWMTEGVARGLLAPTQPERRLVAWSH